MIGKDELLKEKAYLEVEKYKEKVATDRYRLDYHVMPPVGLLNDPNGFVYFNGSYHLFYQWNPFKPDHGAKFWAHLVSKDLVHWETCPVALAPSDWFDKNGCYSGSAVVEDGKLILFYTGNVRDEAGNRETYQCKAVSEDGIHFEKLGPVIYQPEGYTAHFRDPKVFKQEDAWYLVIGAQRTDETGCVLLYKSVDLDDWQLQGPLAGSHLNGLEEFGYMWECPDLFQLEGKDVLVVSPQGLEPEGINYQNIYQAGYFAGTVDYKETIFKHQPFCELDRGFDFYAPQTTDDPAGRRLLFGWMGVPEEDELFHPTRENNWIHIMTIPRVLTWKKDKVFQQPAEELKNLREKHVQKSVQLENQSIELESSNSFELLLDVASDNAEEFAVRIGEAAKLSYHPADKLFTLERKSIKNPAETEKRQCVLESLEEIRIFKDTSSIEVFLNEGEEVFSARLFEAADSIVYSAEGNVSFHLDMWNLRKVTG